jgi:hypothetical protein
VRASHSRRGVGFTKQTQINHLSQVEVLDHLSPDNHSIQLFLNLQCEIFPLLCLFQTIKLTHQ